MSNLTPTQEAMKEAAKGTESAAKEILYFDESTGTVLVKRESDRQVALALVADGAFFRCPLHLLDEITSCCGTLAGNTH